MGWKWTTNDPTPIFLSYKKMWEQEYIPHFHQLCQGVVLPLHQLVFNRRCLRFTKESITDLQVIGRYFLEESFSYIRIFGSQDFPHVLSMYVLDKLLAREVAYKTVGNVITKSLGEMKKSLRPNFSLQCMSFTLLNYGHAYKEYQNMYSLKLPILLARNFDPHYIANKFTLSVKIRSVTHAIDEFENLMESVKDFKQILNAAKTNFYPEKFKSFQEFRGKRLEYLPQEFWITDHIIETKSQNQNKASTS